MPSGQAGRSRLALLGPAVFIPRAIDLKEVHREVELSRITMSIIVRHGALLSQSHRALAGESRIDRAVRGYVVDLAARRTDVHEIPVTQIIQGCS